MTIVVFVPEKSVRVTQIDGKRVSRRSLVNARRRARRGVLGRFGRVRRTRIVLCRNAVIRRGRCAVMYLRRGQTLMDQRCGKHHVRIGLSRGYHMTVRDNAYRVL